MNITDKILLKQLSFHNDAAFIQLYNVHTRAIFVLAMQLAAGDKMVAEKMVQNTWVAAVENLSGYTWKTSFRKWLVSILVNCSLEHYNKGKEYMLIDNNFSEMLASKLRQLKGEARTMSYEEAMGSLPIGYRHVFILHDIYGYKHQEIADYLRISEGCCTNQLFKARKALRQLLESYYPQKVDRYFDWSEAEMKTFRLAYRYVALSHTCREKVTEFFVSRKGAKAAKAQRWFPLGAFASIAPLRETVFRILKYAGIASTPTSRSYSTSVH